jgi:hypothetical protein
VLFAAPISAKQEAQLQAVTLLPLVVLRLVNNNRASAD